VISTTVQEAMAEVTPEVSILNAPFNVAVPAPVSLLQAVLLVGLKVNAPAESITSVLPLMTVVLPE